MSILVVALLLLAVAAPFAGLGAFLERRRLKKQPAELHREWFEAWVDEHSHEAADKLCKFLAGSGKARRRIRRKREFLENDVMFRVGVARVIAEGFGVQVTGGEEGEHG